MDNRAKKILPIAIKGDPSIRQFVFEQQRVESLFDSNINQVCDIVGKLLTVGGVFHAKIHFSSNQLTCWEYLNPYNYVVHVGEDIFADDFLENNYKAVDINVDKIPCDDVFQILEIFKEFRTTDSNFYLRNASINIINQTIGMTFSCDGSHYIPFDEFYSAAKHFSLRS